MLALYFYSHFTISLTVSQTIKHVSINNAWICAGLGTRQVSVCSTDFIWLQELTKFEWKTGALLSLLLCVSSPPHDAPLQKRLLVISCSETPLLTCSSDNTESFPHLYTECNDASICGLVDIPGSPPFLSTYKAAWQRSSSSWLCRGLSKWSTGRWASAECDTPPASSLQGQRASF